MAKIITESVVVKFSKLVPDTAADQSVITEDTVLALEQVAQELAAAGVVVEMESGRD